KNTHPPLPKNRGVVGRLFAALPRFFKRTMDAAEVRSECNSKRRGTGGGQVLSESNSRRPMLA
ncbi:hypothetical protein, partial [Acidithiobacillus ferridurans]|uniref:hypothetical protein n=1 Tax=Acidithiobacillus ferridurans TaxID=1232575 RepID=UPI001C06C786